MKGFGKGQGAAINKDGLHINGTIGRLFADSAAGHKDNCTDAAGKIELDANLLSKIMARMVRTMTTKETICFHRGTSEKSCSSSYMESPMFFVFSGRKRYPTQAKKAVLIRRIGRPTKPYSKKLISTPTF